MFNSAQHFELLEDFFKGRSAVIDSGKGPYPWRGVLEDNRLEIQSRPVIGGNGWLENHIKFLEGLKNSGFKPKKIFTIGTGKDASLLPALLTFPVTESIKVIEFEKDKLDGAQQTLAGRGFDLSRFEFIWGDAATELKKLDKANAIITQLIEQHQPFEAPLWENKETCCTFAKLLEARVDVLELGGILATSDLIIKRWSVVPSPGYENQPEVKELIEKVLKFIHGDGTEQMPGFIQLGWPEARNASAWESENELAKKIEEASQGKLKLLPDLTMSCYRDYKNPENRARINTETSYIIAVITLAAQRALMLSEKALTQASDALTRKLLSDKIEKLKRGIDFLWERGLECVKILEDKRISIIIPPMYYLAFRKIAE